MSLSFRTGKFAVLLTVVGASLVAGVQAQEVRAPDPGTFEAFLLRQMPDLFSPPDAAPPKLLWLGAADVRRGKLAVDSQTGLLPPAPPLVTLAEKLDESAPSTIQYRQRLIQFLQRRQQILELRSRYDNLVRERSRFRALSAIDKAPAYFPQKIGAWNGDIFWAPASKDSDTNLRFGDEVRAVFGPIPPFDVTTLGQIARPDGWTITTGVLVGEADGNTFELKPNPNKPGSPLEFEHRDADGKTVKWTAAITKCDKPSLAGGVTPCGTASRISRAVKGNIEWIALARKTRGAVPLSADPYWMPSNSTYELLGYIGFNRFSGEIAFFDGSYEGMKFNWNSPITPPGGAGYRDDAGRALAAKTYDATFGINCTGCHDNKEPRIITPYIKQARVGYRSDTLGNAFSLKDLLPEMTRSARTPYRVVGTDYTAVHAATISEARTIVDPTRNCTGCHGLTNNGTGRFASDAVARLGTIAGDKGAENGFRTDWALRAGLGKIHPWMVPDDGNVISAEPPPPVLSDADWAALKAIIEQPNSEPRTLKLFTEAPAPESIVTDATRLADPFGPSGFNFQVRDNRDGKTEMMPKEVELSWSYLNGLGGVPERDDVRFNIAIREFDIPAGGVETPMAGYPSIDSARGVTATSIGNGVFIDGDTFVLKDMSFEGHIRWSDPVATTAPRSYRLAFPARPGKRYLIRVLPKRFTFDQTGENYSTIDHVFSIDVR